MGAVRCRRLDFTPASMDNEQDFAQSLAFIRLISIEPTVGVRVPGIA